MQNGWIQIHRKILKSAFYRRSAYVHLWVHLLLQANHKTNKFMWDNKVILVKEGELITGRKALSEETGIPETTIEDILKFLEKSGNVRQQKTTKYRLITIVNWKNYQQHNNRPTSNLGVLGVSEGKTRQQNSPNKPSGVALEIKVSKNSDNRATTDQKKSDTNKNVYNTNTNTKVALATLSSSEEAHREETTLIPVDEDGQEIPKSKWQKKAKTPPNALKWPVARVAARFDTLCQKEVGVAPTGHISVLKAIQRAFEVHKLTEPQIYDLFEEWFSLGRPDEETIHIRKALSDYNINRYRVANL